MPSNQAMKQQTYFRVRFGASSLYELEPEGGQFMPAT